MVILCFKLVILAHVFACIWHYIAVQELANNMNNNWLTANGLDNSDNVTKYITSIYWIFISFFTIGYGDITPVSDSEKVFAICVSFISALSFGLIMN